MIDWVATWLLQRHLFHDGEQLWSVVWVNERGWICALDERDDEWWKRPWVRRHRWFPPTVLAYDINRRWDNDYSVGQR